MAGGHYDKFAGAKEAEGTAAAVVTDGTVLYGLGSDGLDAAAAVVLPAVRLAARRVDHR